MISSIYIVGRDPAKLSEFYATALALPVKFADPGRWHQMNAGNVAFAVASAEEAQPHGQSPALVFEASALDDAHARILAAGATFLGARDMGSHGVVRTYRDPEGNAFQTFTKAQQND
jgi:predicted enzyme related to lactoylglutathione lyase